MRSLITVLSRLALGITLLAAFGWSPAQSQSQSLFGLEAFYPFDDGRNPTAAAFQALVADPPQVPLAGAPPLPLAAAVPLDGAFAAP